MKKLLTTSMLTCFVALLSFGQQKGVALFASTVPNKTQAQAERDTAVNISTKSQVLKVAIPAVVFTLQVTATRKSGASGGVIRVEGSNDNVAWKRLTVTGTLSAADSLNLANSANPQAFFFIDSPSRYLYYRTSLQHTAATGTTEFYTTGVAGY